MGDVYSIGLRSHRAYAEVKYQINEDWQVRGCEKTKKKPIMGGSAANSMIYEVSFSHASTLISTALRVIIKSGLSLLPHSSISILAKSLIIVWSAVQ